jgi:protein tyrosine phosphatase (PTP) superfamily phosphohydrolase (DUF442 family)
MKSLTPKEDDQQPLLDNKLKISPSAEQLKQAVEKKDFQVIIISRKSGESQCQPLTSSQIDNVYAINYIITYIYMIRYKLWHMD